MVRREEAWTLGGMKDDWPYSLDLLLAGYVAFEVFLDSVVEGLRWNG